MKDLRAGRDLDTLVAKCIFGWRHRLVSPALQPGEIRITPGAINNFTDLYSTPEDYSTESEWAWSIVEELQGRPSYVGFELSDQPTEHLCPEESGRWYAGFCLGRGWRSAIGETVEEAICKAALKAVEGA